MKSRCRRAETQIPERAPWSGSTGMTCASSSPSPAPGRLTAAARRLGADHATVSRRIAALEEALKAKLFERRPQGYALTPPASASSPRPRAWRPRRWRSQSDIGGADMALAGTVRIGAPDGFGAALSRAAPRAAGRAPSRPRSSSSCHAAPALAVEARGRYRHHARPAEGRQGGGAQALAITGSGSMRRRTISTRCRPDRASPRISSPIASSAISTT